MPHYLYSPPWKPKILHEIYALLEAIICISDLLVAVYRAYAIKYIKLLIMHRNQNCDLNG
jgi:hypothetical protein